jgi:hypothetical protein
VVFGLAVLVTIASVLTIWAKRQALDTSQWTRTSTQLLESREIRSTLATFLVDELYVGVDVPGALERALPDRLDPLAGPAAAAVRELAIDQAESLLASSAVQDLWAQANRAAHEAFLALLDGDDVGPVSLVDGAVVLDLSRLVARLQERLGLPGRLGGDIGVITILGADQVEPLQRTVRLLRRLTIMLFVVAIALFAAAVWLAQGARRTMLASCGAALLGVGVAVLAARRVTGEGLVESLVEAPSARAAAIDAWLVSTGLLRDLGIALVAYGLVGLAAAWVSGGSRPARAVRRTLAPAFRSYPAAVFAAVALVLLLAILWSPLETGRRLWGTLLIAALIMAGVEALRRQSVREFPAPGRPA